MVGLDGFGLVLVVSMVGLDGLGLVLVVSMVVIDGLLVVGFELQGFQPRRISEKLLTN